jgi:hypothetical protein
LTVDVLFVFVGRQGAVAIAAALNFSVAALAYAHLRGLRGRGAARAEPSGPVAVAPPARAPALVALLPLALVVAALAGGLSLSQEILWARPVAYHAEGAPQVFGHVLGLFLLGVTFGARRGERFCARDGARPLPHLAGLSPSAAAACHFGILLFARANVLAKPAGLFASYAAVFVVAFLSGQALPIIRHFSVDPGGAVGQSLSPVYRANIAGATASPLQTGFVLLDRYTLRQSVPYVSVASALAGAAPYLVATAPPRARATTFYARRGPPEGRPPRGGVKSAPRTSVGPRPL